jgi:biofilm protein TabA
MIAGRMENYQRYCGLSSLFTRAFDYLRTTDLSTLAVGRHPINGDTVYVMVSDYMTKPEPQGVWEAHRRYIDLHCMIAGSERIGYAPSARMKPGRYDAGKDFLPLEGGGDFLTMNSGDFLVFWPEDAHMPGIAIDGPKPVRKAVIKILLR